MHAPLAPNYRTEWRPLAAIEAIAGEWRDLAARAIEANIFYEPVFALAAAPVFGREAGAVLVRSAAGQLVGLFPMQILDWRKGYVSPVLAGYVHPFGPLGIPLVDRDHADPVVQAWLDHLSRDKKFPRMLLMPLIAEGPFAQVLDRALAHRGLGSSQFGRYGRAMLVPGANRATYFEQSIRPKLRRQLRQRRSRLAERGELTSDAVTDPAAMPALITTFLKIEAGGWKGRLGTAAAADRRIQTFMETAIVALAREHKAYGQVLSIGGEPIAAALMLRSGENVWGWKIAYDERFAQFSPGIQVALDLTRGLLDDRSILRADSCTSPDQPMANHIWRERLVLSDRLISLRPGFAPAFRFARIEQFLRRGLIAVAKRVRGRLRKHKIKPAADVNRAPAKDDE